ncbi:MAG: CHAT domain-containing protein [Verrucomicrobiota bacterium]
MKASLRLSLRGQPTAPGTLPVALTSASRGSPAEDPFLGGGILQVRHAFDLSPAARSVAGERTTDVVVPDAETLVVLEAESGETLFLSPETFKGFAARHGLDAGTAVPVDALISTGSAERGVGESPWRRLSILSVADGDLLDAAQRKAADLAREWLGKKVANGVLRGASCIGARALAGVVEARLQEKPGLYQWTGSETTPSGLTIADPAVLARHATEGPLLLFIHGTGSSTEGSFADLRKPGPEWAGLQQTFGTRIYAFEHHTLSASPIENALDLVESLPRGARIRLVTHSRGGLVGDLLSLGRLTDAEIDSWDRVPAPGVDGSELRAVTLRERAQLQSLRTKLANRKPVIERYVRVASPARGTRLASANFDVFLSAMLSVLGTVTGLRASGIYCGISRLVLEIVKRRMDPQVIPGIEAMLPDSPMAVLLGRAARAPGIQFAVIAGDIEGGSLWQRLGVQLTDWTLFDRMSNDLVVDSDSMYEGLVRDGGGYGLFDRGPRVNHFRYFENPRTARALTAWLTSDVPDPTGFERVPDRSELSARETSRSRSRGTTPVVPDGTRPVVIVLPGIMGSHLSLTPPGGKPGSGRRIWFNLPGLVLGSFADLRWTSGPRAPHVEPEGLFEMFYGDLCEHLSKSHHVIRFPYDWRMPVQDEAQRLGDLVESILTALDGRQPVRLVAHSMGGLLCRAMIQGRPELWQQIVAHEGGRLVMLGTPNHGSHLLVQHLIGMADTTRSIARIDQCHDLQEILNVVATLPGALQLLPSPGFVDTSGGPARNYFRTAVWADFKKRVTDWWFGNGVVGIPSAGALRKAEALWTSTLSGGLAPEPVQRVAYVFGRDAQTACGVQVTTEKGRPGKVQILMTPEGDGSVTWKSGRLENLPEDRCWWIPASHTDLTRTAAAFAGLEELLEHGTTSDAPLGPGLNRGLPPVSRGIPGGVVPFEPGPPLVPNEGDLAGGLLGGRGETRRQTPGKASESAPRSPLSISVTAGDLRFTCNPVLCGHYRGDPIAGTEDVLDRQVLHGGLRQRERLGFYPAELGTSTVALLPDSRQPDGRMDRQGALVVGLGDFGSLSSSKLADTVRAGVTRLLLNLQDRRSSLERSAQNPVRITSLILGYNSTTSIGIEDSIASVVSGVLAAARQFHDAFPDSGLQVESLEFIELYLDTAISAARALQRLPDRLASEIRASGLTLKLSDRLRMGPGALPRLADVGRGPNYWSRLIATGDDSAESSKCPGGNLEVRYAERLRYRLLSQRARAETVVQQRQPQLLEGIVRDAIHDTRFNPSLGDFLFQLLVPLDFKELARNTEQLVLVVDGATANFPWEMVTTSGVPLVVRTRLVRQLESTRFRRQVAEATNNGALVVGNPSTSGFGKVFPNVVPDSSSGLVSLTGAEREASAVREILGTSGYEMTPLDAGEDAQTVLSALFRRPHRILHIAAHGLYGFPGADGQARSGVVLSDGMLLTAAEVGQMEVVPEVVFLNCCHLGKTDVLPRETGRLAYSLSRELIEMGVRCVIAAGWEVDDEAAELFARTFYTQLVVEGQGFGDAVFEARKQVWETHSGCNTWGAYQAYGDPTFRLDREPPARPKTSRRTWVSPLEVETELEQWITRATRRGPQPGPTPAELEVLLKEIPSDFLESPEVQSALGRLHAALGDFEKARAAYETALSASDERGRLPVRTLEQLANLEARHGEKSGNLELIDHALRRLEGLLGIGPGRETATLLHGNSERLSLYASAIKRKAVVLLRQKGDLQALRDNLSDASRVYADAMKCAGAPGIHPYPALNHLHLSAVLGQAGAYAGDLAETAAAAARAAFQREPTFFNAVMPMDAEVMVHWLRGSLPAATDTLIQNYRDAGDLLPSTIQEWDSVTSQLQLLAEFGDRLGVPGERTDALRAIAAGIREGTTSEPSEYLQTPSKNGQVHSAENPSNHPPRRKSKAATPTRHPNRQRK